MNEHDWTNYGSGFYQASQYATAPQHAYRPYYAPAYYYAPVSPRVGAWEAGGINWAEVIAGAAVGAVFALILGRAFR